MTKEETRNAEDAADRQKAEAKESTAFDPAGGREETVSAQDEASGAEALEAEKPSGRGKKTRREKTRREKAAEKKAGREKELSQEEKEPEIIREPLIRTRPSAQGGLTADQVQNRVENGAVNTPVDAETVTLKGIILSNVLTYFNLIFLIIAICLIAVGSFRDLTFLPIIIANTGIGIFQEWRSKVLLDKMNMINAPRTKVVRDGEVQTISSDLLVLDDIVLFEAGNQIPADAVVEEGELQVNESLLTGEADEVTRKAGDVLMSGSFVVSGQCRARLEKVGADSYISKLTLEAKAQKRGEQSEMIRSLTRLVKIVGIVILPIAGLLFYQHYYINHVDMKGSVTSTVAAILGMIPEGLYLLASVAMAVSAMRLALNKVLVHNMKSIETLARVDVLCVDKTGTITENTMTVREAVPMTDPEAFALFEDRAYQEDEELTEEENFPSELVTSLEICLGDFVYAMSADNITMEAMKQYFVKKSGKRAERVVPFSSVHKYSGAKIGGISYVLGAPEFVLREDFARYAAQIERHTARGYRVLVFGEYQGELTGKELTAPVAPLGMVLLMNPVRKNAPETFRYFEEQGVTVKVISGDSPMTVAEVAGQAGIRGADRFVDASLLTDEELCGAAAEYTVFGRVTPQQKRLLVAALKKGGHTVAMTGDGVNDVLALKDADCSVAMASGSDAAAHAAQMVLLESDFSKMPAVVSEGRRVVNNIERTASLFLVKNIFSLLMSIFSIVLKMSYPLEPSQISLISMFTIGAPAFFMALETNRRRITGHFLSNVFFKALPAGLTDFLVISALVIFCQEFGVGETDLSTSCTILLAIVGIMILLKIMSPMTKFHWVLWFSMIFGLLFCMVFLKQIFAISALSRKSVMLLAIFAIITEPALRYLSLLIQKIWDLFSWLRRKIRESKEASKRAFMRIG